MSNLIVRNVSGFSQEPVSLSDEAAVFAGFSRRGDRLYRVDAGMTALCTRRSGTVIQVLQTQEGILTLEKASDGTVSLNRLSRDLRPLERRPLFTLSEGERTDQCALTEERVLRLTCPAGDGEEDMISALHLDCWPLSGGEVHRITVTLSDVRRLLGHRVECLGLLSPAGILGPLIWADRAWAVLNLCCRSEPDPWTEDTERPILLLADLSSGALSLLWCDNLHNQVPDDELCRPCFFDFDRDLMWTRPRSGGEESLCPGDKKRSALVARSIHPDSFIREDCPVWASAGDSERYFDGAYCFDVSAPSVSPLRPAQLYAVLPDGSRLRYQLPEGVALDFHTPIVPWQNRLLVLSEGGAAPIALPLSPAVRAETPCEELPLHWADG